MTGGGRECEAVIRLLQKEKEQKVHEVCGMPMMYTRHCPFCLL